MAAFEVIADQAVAAFYDVVCTILEHDQLSDSGLTVWARNWCESAAQAGFFSTLVDSLETMSVTAPVAKNAARLLFQILVHLGFASPSQKQFFDCLASAGSMQGFMVRVLENIGTKEWARPGILVVSAVLAGSYSNQDFRTCQPSYSADWISFAIQHSLKLFEESDYSANLYECEQVVENPLKSHMASNFLIIERALCKYAYRLGQSRKPASEEYLMILLQECERSGPISVDLVSWLLETYHANRSICHICIKSLLQRELCGEGGQEMRKLIPQVISRNEFCAGYIIDLLHQDQDTIVNLLGALQSSLEQDAVVILVKEGLFDRLNRILLGDPSNEALRLVLLTLQKVLASKYSKNLISSLQLGSTLQCICNKMFAFLKKFAASKANGTINTVSNQFQYFSAAAAMMILATVMLKDLDGADTSPFLEDRGQTVIQVLLEDSELYAQCSLLCLTMQFKANNNHNSQGPPNVFSNYKCQAQISTHFTSSFYNSVQRMLMGENLVWKAIAVVCIALDLDRRKHTTGDLNECVSAYAFASRFKNEYLADFIVVIQNALMDPLWTLDLKILAIFSLDIVISEPMHRISCKIISLEWFRILAIHAFSAIQSSTPDSLISWLPWVVYLRVTSPHLIKLKICDLYNRTNLRILQELTIQCGNNFLGLGALASLWMTLLKANTTIVDEGLARELKAFFMSVFNEISGTHKDYVDHYQVHFASDVSTHDAVLNSVIYAIINRLDPQHSNDKDAVLNIIVETVRLLSNYQPSQPDLNNSCMSDLGVADLEQSME